jgi:hypothetical protein
VTDLSARNLQIELVGTEIELARPHDGALFRDAHLLEHAGIIPDGEYAAARQRGEVNDTVGTIVEAKFKPVTR